ncbi:MAG: ribonuclease J [Rhodospirillales bacterium]|jgi:ribonuclease J|nr:ribonuclease J [Rhodospirillales bacterium]
MTKKNEDLVFVPLGGTGEIGMNLNLYGYGEPGKRQWLMIDLGITFANGNTPGVDVILPDPSFIEERVDRLAGLVLTHAHEDHIGAVPYLWDRLRCPIYGTPFTLSVLRRKLREDAGEFASEVPIHEVPLSGHFQIGPFDLEMVTLTHSIPEPNAIALRTPVGTILHTGDWKLDPDPVIGAAAEKDALRKMGDDGVHAIVCDSTNVFEESESGSEADLLESLTEVIGRCENRVAVGCFASNVARLETISKAAAANGRSAVLAGRSLWRMYEAARENGYLNDIPAFLDENDVAHLAKEQTLIICTGSQGEPRAALSRIADGSHPRVRLEREDTVIFSSRVIPGNEISIARIQNLLTRKGVRIITQDDSFVHVSGHPARDEMKTMYELVRPTISVPVHGESRHLAEHAELARECGAGQVVLIENGAVVRLGPGEARVIDEAPVGRLAIEGSRLVPLGGQIVRSRVKAMYAGSAMVTVVLDSAGKLVGDPQISQIGVLEEGEETPLSEVRAEISRAVAKLRENDDEAASEAVRLATRRTFRKTVGKKPLTQVHVVRI